MKRPTVSDEGEPTLPIRVDTPKMLTKLATVSELLVQPTWDDGVVKGERAVFVFLEGALTKILVKVGNPPLKLMVSARSWDDAWAALEAVLRSEDIPWEQDRPRDQSGPKKKK